MQGRLGLRERLAVVLVAAVLPLVALAGWLALDAAGDSGASRGELLAAVLAGLAAAWWAGWRLIVGPARQILAAVRQLEKGRPDARVPLAGRHAASEFARIAAAFNLMADSLEVRRNDLEAELGRSRGAYAVLETVLNSMQEGLIAVDPAGRFLMYNRAAAGLFPIEGPAVPPHEWPRHFGLHVPGSEALHEPDNMPFARAMRGEAGEMPVLVRNALVPQGRLLRCNYGPMHDLQGITGGLVVFTDITALERAESDLVLLRNAVARLNDVVLITEAHPLDLPGPRIVFVNEAFERLTGYPAREAIGNTPRMLQGPGTDRAALDRVRSALAQRQPVREELLNYAKDGHAFWVEMDIVPMADETGRYTHLIAVQRDISARKRFEQRLLANEREVRELNASLESRIAERTAELVRQGRLYRTLAEQAPEVVWNTDASGSTLTFLNRAWYDLVGGTEADWLGHSGLSAIHPDDREEVQANWLRSRETLATFTGVRRIRARDGSYHTMSYKGAPVFDEDGALAFWVGIDSDITGLKAIEEALRASNQELEAFSYSVSHDLRAPLGAIDGFSKALAGRLQGLADDKALHYLSRIQAGVVKMEQLIEALLGLSRVARETLRPQAVDLGALARETLEGLQMQQPERSLVARVQDGLEVRGDPRLLRIVLENLLGNAWKFTSRVAQPVIEVGRLPDGGACYVRDNGVGFDMAYAGKLFNVFHRLHTESEFPGTGIGLATVRRIVARHQGRVWAESRPGEGTTFYFTLSPP